MNFSIESSSYEIIFCFTIFSGSEIMVICFKDISVYEISGNIAMEIPHSWYKLIDNIVY